MRGHGARFELQVWNLSRPVLVSLEEDQGEQEQEQEQGEEEHQQE